MMASNSVFNLESSDDDKKDFEINLELYKNTFAILSQQKGGVKSESSLSSFKSETTIGTIAKIKPKLKSKPKSRKSRNLGSCLSGSLITSVESNNSFLDALPNLETGELEDFKIKTRKKKKPVRKVKVIWSDDSSTDSGIGHCVKKENNVVDAQYRENKFNFCESPKREINLKVLNEESKFSMIRDTKFKSEMPLKNKYDYSSDSDFFVEFNLAKKTDPIPAKKIKLEFDSKENIRDSLVIPNIDCINPLDIDNEHSGFSSKFDMDVKNEHLKLEEEYGAIASTQSIQTRKKKKPTKKAEVVRFDNSDIVSLPKKKFIAGAQYKENKLNFCESMKHDINLKVFNEETQFKDMNIKKETSFNNSNQSFISKFNDCIISDSKFKSELPCDSQVPLKNKYDHLSDAVSFLEKTISNSAKEMKVEFDSKEDVRQSSATPDIDCINLLDIDMEHSGLSSRIATDDEDELLKLEEEECSAMASLECCQDSLDSSLEIILEKSSTKASVALKNELMYEKPLNDHFKPFHFEGRVDFTSEKNTTEENKVRSRDIMDSTSNVSFEKSQPISFFNDQPRVEWKTTAFNKNKEVLNNGYPELIELNDSLDSLTEISLEKCLPSTETLTTKLNTKTVLPSISYPILIDLEDGVDPLIEISLKKPSKIVVNDVPFVSDSKIKKELANNNPTTIELEDSLHSFPENFLRKHLPKTSTNHLPSSGTIITDLNKKELLNSSLPTVTELEDSQDSLQVASADESSCKPLSNHFKKHPNISKQNSSVKHLNFDELSGVIEEYSKNWLPQSEVSLTVKIKTPKDLSCNNQVMPVHLEDSVSSLPDINENVPVSCNKTPPKTSVKLKLPRVQYFPVYNVNNLPDINSDEAVRAIALAPSCTISKWHSDALLEGAVVPVHLENSVSSPKMSVKQKLPRVQYFSEYNVDNLPDINSDESFGAIANFTSETLAPSCIISKCHSDALLEGAVVPVHLEDSVSSLPDISCNKSPPKMSVKQKLPTIQYFPEYNLDNLPGINRDESIIPNFTSKTLAPSCVISKCHGDALPEGAELSSVVPTFESTCSSLVPRTNLAIMPNFNNTVDNTYNLRNTCDINDCRNVLSITMENSFDQRLILKYALNLPAEYSDLYQLANVNIKELKRITSQLSSFYRIIESTSEEFLENTGVENLEDNGSSFYLTTALHAVRGSIIPNKLIPLLVKYMDASSVINSLKIFDSLMESLRLEYPKNLNQSMDIWSRISDDIASFIRLLSLKDCFKYQSTLALKYFVSVLANDVERHSIIHNENSLRGTFVSKLFDNRSRRLRCIIRWYGETLHLICDRNEDSLSEDDLFLTQSIETLLKIALICDSEYLDAIQLVAHELSVYYDKLKNVDSKELFLELIYNTRLIRYFLSLNLLVKNYGVQLDNSNVYCVNLNQVVDSYVGVIFEETVENALEHLLLLSHLIFDYKVSVKEELHRPIYQRNFGNVSVLLPRSDVSAFQKIAHLVDFVIESSSELSPEIIKHPICIKIFGLFSSLKIFDFYFEFRYQN